MAQSLAYYLNQISENVIPAVNNSTIQVPVQLQGSLIAYDTLNNLFKQEVITGNVNTILMQSLVTQNVSVVNLPATQNVNVVGSSITQNVSVINTPTIGGQAKVRLGAVISTLVGANTNVFASNLTATINGLIYITALTDTTANIELITVLNGQATVITGLLNGGSYLLPNGWYVFNGSAMIGDNFNIQFNTTATVSVYIDNAIF
jgi:hypothetical protein